MNSRTPNPDESLQRARSFTRIGCDFHARGQLIEAAAAFQRAALCAPDATLYYNWGTVLEEAGQLQDAINAFRLSLSLDPTLVPAHNNLGVTLARMGCKRKARQVFKQVLHYTEGHSEHAFQRSAAFYNLGRIDKAVNAYLEAVEHSPQQAAAYTDLYKALSQVHRMEPLLASRGQATTPTRLFSWKPLALPARLRELFPLGNAPRRQAYVGAGILTATALTPVLAWLPQSTTYREAIGSVAQAVQPTHNLGGARLPTSAPGIGLSANRLLPLAPGPTRTVPSSSTLQTRQENTHTTRTTTRRLARTEPVVREATATSEPPPSPVVQRPASLEVEKAEADLPERRVESTKDYNLRVGPVEFDLSAYNRYEYNDNITSSGTESKDDLIATAGLDLDAHWELTRFNSLDLTLGTSFSKYFDHSELDSSHNFLTLSPDSQLSLNAQIGDILFTLYDKLAYSVDPVDSRTPTAGGNFEVNVSRYSRFENQAGLSAQWEGRQMLVKTGIEREDVLPQDEVFDFARRIQYNFPIDVHYAIAKDKAVGANFLYSTMESRNVVNGYSSNDGKSVKIGPYVEWSPDPAIKVQAGVSYANFTFDNNGLTQDHSDENTVNAHLQIDQEVSRRYRHGLTLTRSTDYGLTSNTTTANKIAYGFDFKVIRDTFAFGTASYEHGEESGPKGEAFDRYRGTLGLEYRLSENLSLSTSYTHTNKDSDQSLRSYDQNRVLFGIQYDF